MLRSLAVTCIATALLSCGGLPAAAATPPPLQLQSYTLSVAPPIAPASACDQGSLLFCGSITVTTRFSGLDGRQRPTAPGPPNGDVSGTVQVTRIYGCQTASRKWLGKYTRKVVQDVSLDTRRSSGFVIPATGDALTVTTYAFLLDAQPKNCPPSTQAIQFQITASGARLFLSSSWSAIPSSHYSAPGRAVWCGAVPTPVPTPVAN